ncbi:hypothetical protein [Marvinbryantia formatexigens]|nr:hypothetical protein [Marvinbryantia formatexigens]UWO25023.1 hypothetical protein NQ534_00560 [Marvinbryantia formatexigens DSM 14469]
MGRYEVIREPCSYRQRREVKEMGNHLHYYHARDETGYRQNQRH